MTKDITITQLHSAEEHINELTELLIQVVEGGASIGFLPPLDRSVAIEYWQNVLKQDVILFIAKLNNQIVGTVQLHSSSSQNGAHRMEIAKLMTHPNYRNKGIAKMLMNHAEERAKQEGKTLLILDTRKGDPSNLLYSSIGFIEAGQIPNFARSSDGQLHTTVFYYKILK
ncbi:GNAT family N-acetyltransferase [Sutcliffiella halmapala]|uniref:GNAT family N-acetyltransferase n=1 Tax=Sutcliffiella halmapala TaxID=79882 RepID=UPI0011168E7C|nr:GNAT family N-acetyltransferase [Sutcliffiella halmapala]